MVEKISVQIGLEGGDKVEQQLADIGTTGEQAFAKTGEAADKAAESTSKFSLETVKTSAEIAAATTKIALHGVEIVQAVRHHDTLLQSIIKLAGGFSTASKVVAAFTPELALVGVTLGSTVAAIAAGVVALEAVEKVVTKLAASTEKLNNTLQTLAATTGQSFENLQRGEAAFEQIGIKAETFRGTIAKIGETLAATDTKNLTKGMSDIVSLVNQIAAGQKGITFADWVTAEDKVKGVAIAMKQAADAGKNATQVLLEFLRTADLATAIKVGAAFGLSEADVDRVRRYDGAISDLIQKIGAAPPLISPENAAAFERMRTSIQNVDSAWARLKQSISTTDFQAMAATFSAVMNEMQAAVLNAAAAISESLGQAFTGMMTQAKSDVAEIGAALSQLAQITGAADLFKQMQADAVTANAAVANFVGSIMQGMGASAASIQAVKDSINGVAQATATAGQSAQQAGVMFTSFGTVASEGANTAQKTIQQTTTMFTSFGTVASASGQQADAAMRQAAGGATTLATAVQSGSDKVAEFASKIAGITWDAISSAGVAAWNALTGAIQSAIDKLLQFIGLKPSAPATGGGAPGKASGGLLGGRGSGTSDSNLAWVSRGEYIMPARAVRQPGVLSFLEALRGSGRIPGFAEGGAVGGQASSLIIAPVLGRLAKQLLDITNSIHSIMAPYMQSVADFVQTAKGMDHSMAGVQNAIMKVADELTAMENSIKAKGGNARGGLLGGRGTGTSDSNLAWVSRGEHIMPARAVAQPGVLAFLEALRRSGGNLADVLNGMGRFALGGMVPRAIPAFASGGLAGGSNVTIQFPGLPAISGLRASSSVVDQLQKAAALAQVRSGGRKPSRYS